ncbi:PadR family transcriptional regulator [Rothia nasimurium]|uniref:PadR family transcriptional regulator n=1 Tax=Rothia nasimurium TaxID=85336 RepID=UPI001F4427FC|nr:PadR family transcriptional regulator [Rothia nasimurium]
MNPTTYPPALVRATLPTAVLACLAQENLHGYGLATRLEEMGYGRLRGGSLYPALSKLEEAGYVTTAWMEGESGPARRQYRLTDAGARQLADERATLARLTSALGA